MKKEKHLEFIENIITRMNSNSFLIKGWCVSIVSVIFIFSKKNINPDYLFFSLIPCLSFWILDGFFISTERKFKQLYNHVIQLNENDIDFSMNTTEFKKFENSWFRGIVSKTLLPFYGIIVLGILIVYKYIS